jgi:hypothetical protein
MNTISAWKVLAITLMIVCPLSAAALGTVTDGDVTFGYTNDFNSSRSDTVDTDFTGAAAGDLTYESWWFFRVSGDGAETAFGNPDAENYTLYGGTVGRLDWDDPGGAGLFSAALAFEVRDTGIDKGLLFQTLHVVNTTVSDLTIDIFHYTDLDLSATFGGDSASIVANPDGIEMSVTDGTNFAPFIGYGADAYQISRWSTVLRDLTDGNVDDLNNSGDGFGPGDFTGAFQWSATVGVGASLDFITQFGSDTPLVDPTTSPVPEPNTALLLCLGLFGLARRGRVSA